MFTREGFVALTSEALPYMQDNYEETSPDPAKFPLDIDFDGFVNYERLGRLHCYAARHDSELVAYAIYCISPTLLQRRCEVARSVAVYVRPLWRKGYMPIKFLRYCTEQMEALGVNAISHHIDAAHGVIFERIGYKKHETEYIKVM